ncbi:hypothetical protein GT042_37310 [Streptomyces sp. SID3212]|nr:hypothetical protein [Streptomyces sp. SID3212]
MRAWKNHKSECRECGNREKLALCPPGTRLLNVCIDEYVSKLRSEKGKSRAGERYGTSDTTYAAAHAAAIEENLVRKSVDAQFPKIAAFLKET